MCHTQTMAYSEIFKGGCLTQKSQILGLRFVNKCDLTNSKVFVFQYYTERVGCLSPQAPPLDTLLHTDLGWYFCATPPGSG